MRDRYDRRAMALLVAAVVVIVLVLAFAAPGPAVLIAFPLGICVNMAWRPLAERFRAHQQS